MIAEAGRCSRRSCHDGADNITAITDSIDTGRSRTFTYDGVYRLLSADGAYGSIDYTYDAVGNGALWTMQAELFGSVLVFVIML